MRKKRKVSITISIPAFNRLELLKRTLASVFAQIEPPDEIVVVDNCSNDGTWEYLQAISGIKLYRNKKNIGAIKNYNKCLRLANSDYVVALGSDDLLLPDYIKFWKVKIAEVDRDDVYAFTSAGYIIDENDRVKGIVKPLSKDTLLSPPKTIKAFWDNYYFFNMQTSFWTVYKKELFKKIGYFTDKYNRIIDGEMTIKIISQFPIYYCAKPLGACRIHLAQAIEKKVGDEKKKREYLDRIDASRLLRDYENDPNVAKSFTEKERKNRIFVRKPLVFLLMASCYYFIKGDIQRAKGYMRIFRKVYPPPIISNFTARLVAGWLVNFFVQFGRNNQARLEFKERGVLE